MNELVTIWIGGQAYAGSAVVYREHAPAVVKAVAYEPITLEMTIVQDGEGAAALLGFLDELDREDDRIHLAEIRAALACVRSGETDPERIHLSRLGGILRAQREVIGG